jgi:hypothetical protein
MIDSGLGRETQSDQCVREIKGSSTRLCVPEVLGQDLAVLQ